MKTSSPGARQVVVVAVGVVVVALGMGLIPDSYTDSYTNSYTLYLYMVMDMVNEALTREGGAEPMTREGGAEPYLESYQYLWIVPWIDIVLL